MKHGTEWQAACTNDTITGTPSGDFLLLSDFTAQFFIAPQTVCGVEECDDGNLGDGCASDCTVE